MTLLEREPALEALAAALAEAAGGEGQSHWSTGRHPQDLAGRSLHSGAPR